MTSYSSQNCSSETTSNINFNILDCNGNELIKYKKLYYAVINPYIFLKNNSYTNMYELRALTYTLKSYKKEYDLFGTDVTSTSKKLYWQIDKDTYNKIKEVKDVNGFYTYVYNEVDRSEASDICNILTNFKDNNNKNKSTNSLENSIMTIVKNNEYPQKKLTYDNNGIIERDTNYTSNNNVNVKLTIDETMNNKVDSILNSSDFSKYKQIGIVIMESDTGKIKVITQKDKYKGNIVTGIGDGYLFPGSIFKTIVEEAALENNKINLSETFKDNGNYSSEKRNGTYSVEQAYIMSSNEIFMNIGNITGFNNIYNMAKAQGLLGKVLNLNYEQYGILHMDATETGDISLLSIGEKFRITPLEALSLPNTVINKGIYVKPQIIDSYVNDNGKVISAQTAVQNRVISENTANIMKEQMGKVVSDASGTGKLANVIGNDVGGKTGTATRPEKENHVDGWFVGFFKCGEKYYSAVVLVPDIDSKTEEGGTTAAPVFKKVVEALNK